MICQLTETPCVKPLSEAIFYCSGESAKPLGILYTVKKISKIVQSIETSRFRVTSIFHTHSQMQNNRVTLSIQCASLHHILKTAWDRMLLLTIFHKKRDTTVCGITQQITQTDSYTEAFHVLVRSRVTFSSRNRLITRVYTYIHAEK